MRKIVGVAAEPKPVEPRRGDLATLRRRVSELAAASRVRERPEPAA